ncbi:TetR/AcrR family transcriptional regulator C-terminal domain-containing protein [Plantactinospora sp. KBS50]|uniref:TetR/AcrR family transcriptional regulator C-terminal domain-containing protein n=1 Tax=Plantactinospora sp. KBS50 TaxID=2024580 RepID=UPI000BAAAF74|nr:TetR/AcrR family transcriptional regulator C-terminal domain-containing protein [Plantactinospora sp. KBS50]ASW54089.1 GntR family transcriptional regulator [Plantactinospora sp. KBS50]
MSRPDPPYQRIFTAIRDRIAAGELRPGDPVPSARRIARDWTVAIATATKAHAALRRAGLTEVLPGVGTVVATPASATTRSTGAGRPAPEIGRDRIVRAAVEIADADGLAELSMRRVATGLGVATMSLYRYVAGKEELVLHMIDAVFGEQPPDPPGPGGWRAELERIARSMWAMFQRHPWLAPAMSLTRPQLAPNALAITGRVLGALAGTGLSTEDRFRVHVTLFSFVRGVATALEPEAEARRDTGLTEDEWMATQQTRLWELADRSPVLPPLLGDGFDFDLDVLFEFGLGRLLDGFEAYLRVG